MAQNEGRKKPVSLLLGHEHKHPHVSHYVLSGEPINRIFKHLPLFQVSAHPSFSADEPKLMSFPLNRKGCQTWAVSRQSGVYQCQGLVSLSRSQQSCLPTLWGSRSRLISGSHTLPSELTTSQGSLMPSTFSCLFLGRAGHLKPRHSIQNGMVAKCTDWNQISREKS